jgi:hypothetical protein
LATESGPPREPTEEDRRYASRVAAEAFTEGAERVEVVEGNRITIRDLAKTYAAVWSSGARVVNIIFYRDALHAPGMGEQRARGRRSFSGDAAWDAPAIFAEISEF